MARPSLLLFLQPRLLFKLVLQLFDPHALVLLQSPGFLLLPLIVFACRVDGLLEVAGSLIGGVDAEDLGHLFERLVKLGVRHELRCPREVSGHFLFLGQAAPFFDGLADRLFILVPLFLVVASLFFLLSFPFEVFDGAAGLFLLGFQLLFRDLSLLLFVGFPVRLFLDLHAFPLEDPPLLVRQLFLLLGQLPAVFFLDLASGELLGLAARFQELVLLLLPLLVDAALFFRQFRLRFFFEPCLFLHEPCAFLFEAALELVLHLAQPLFFLPPARFGCLLLDPLHLFELLALLKSTGLSGLLLGPLHLFELLALLEGAGL